MGRKRLEKNIPAGTGEGSQEAELTKAFSHFAYLAWDGVIDARDRVRLMQAERVASKIIDNELRAHFYDRLPAIIESLFERYNDRSEILAFFRQGAEFWKLLNLTDRINELYQQQLKKRNE